MHDGEGHYDITERDLFVRDYQKEMASYLDGLKAGREDRLDRAIERIRESRYVCVFGAGMTSQRIVFLLRSLFALRIDFMCDNDAAKWGKCFYGDLVCLSPAELRKHRAEVAVIVASIFWEPIYAQLCEMDFDQIYVFGEYRLANRDFLHDRDNLPAIRKNVLHLMEILEDDHSRGILNVLIRNWFDPDFSGAVLKAICTGDSHYPMGIIDLTDQESFVDAGAYNGDTLLEFIDRTRGSFEEIHAFELDQGNFKALESTVNRLDGQTRDKIHLYPCGVWNEEKMIGYEAGYRKGEDSRISEAAGAVNVAKVVRLSDMLKDRKVTYLNMDIEGSEMEALSGAEELLVRQKPRLAISIYHKPRHLWEIPLYLKRLVPEYKIYIRHHAVLDCETICYATI
ncbi:FkbM family methyltransferase [Syntrophus sp. (in: bacteria)]|uniref:FkbM family methyltransferase n=1 Tax=Syntrophus sp. (in: bacteria) TaxID=48412 RepID=UPI00345E8C10